MKTLILLCITLVPLLANAQKPDTTATVKSLWQYNNASPVNISLGISQFGPQRTSYNVDIKTVYYFSGNYIARMGFGMEFIHYNYLGLNSLPVLLDEIIYLPFKKIKPFVALDDGGAFSLSRNYKIGVLFNPSIGVSVPVSKSTNADISLGFLGETYNLTKSENTYSGVLETFDINLGVNF